jgi:hypothetical protein
MGAVQTQPTCVIIPFPDAAVRAKPPAEGRTEPLGRLLLFTGVRYERRPDPSPALSDSQGPAHHRRRS